VSRNESPIYSRLWAKVKVYNILLFWEIVGDPL